MDQEPEATGYAYEDAARALSDHVTTLQEQLAKADARADREAEERARLLALVEGLRASRDRADVRADRAEAELARLQAAPVPIPKLAPEAEAALVREDEWDAPADPLVATMAAEIARAQALVPAPTPRRGFLVRLLNRKPPPATIPAPEAEADQVREGEWDAPADQLVATMAIELSRAQALVPAPTPRRGFLARLLNRKPADPTL